MWQVDVGERTPLLAAAMCISGDRTMLALATMTLSQSFAFIAFRAWCSAYMDEEQAVSIVKLWKMALACFITCAFVYVQWSLAALDGT